MTESHPTELHANPDWYRVKFALAAEYTNWALDGEREEDDVKRLERASAAVEELQLAIAAALRTSPRKRRGRRPRPTALQALLLEQIGPSVELLSAGIRLAWVRLGTLGPGAADDAVAYSRAVAERVKATGPHDPDVEYNLACVYVQGGALDDSKEHLRAAVERTNPSARRFLLERIATDPVLEPVRDEALRFWISVEERESIAASEDAPPRQRSWV